MHGRFTKGMNRKWCKMLDRWTAHVNVKKVQDLQGKVMSRLYDKRVFLRTNEERHEFDVMTKLFECLPFLHIINYGEKTRWFVCKIKKNITHFLWFNRIRFRSYLTHWIKCIIFDAQPIILIPFITLLPFITKNNHIKEKWLHKSM